MPNGVHIKKVRNVSSEHVVLPASLAQSLRQSAESAGNILPVLLA